MCVISVNPALMCMCVDYVTAVSVERPSQPGDCKKSGGFLCQGDGRCLNNSSMCDDVADCTDGSDELNCTGLT